jgi:biotin carboxyl carrier protein
MRRYTVTVDGTPFTIDVEETAADRFSVTVGDRTFEASLEAAEDLPGAVITPAIAQPGSQRAPGDVAAAPVPAGEPSSPAADPGRATPAASGRGPSASAAGVPPRTQATPASASRELVTAPMPGVVLEVHVAPGAIVSRGDPLLVLEAMKMRNTIRAPRDGVVTEVTTEAGRPVAPGEPLVRIGAATR